MSRFIFSTRYINKSEKKSLASLVKYVGTREGVELNTETVNEQHADILAKYMGERPGVDKQGSHGLFSSSDKSIKLSAVMNELASHKGNIWTNVLSLKRSDADRLSYNNQKMWKDLINSKLLLFSQQFKIPIENLRYYAAYHDHPEHPHCHMLVYSTDPKQGYLSEAAINIIKSNLANEIFKLELTELYEQKTVLRDNIRKYSSEYIGKLVSNINHKSTASTKLVNKMTDLAVSLASCSGKMQYGYLPPKVKLQVDDIVSEISSDKNISELYKAWCKVKLKQNTFAGHNKIYADGVAPLLEQKKFKTIKNAVIKEAVNIVINTDLDQGSDEIQVPDLPSDKTEADIISQNVSVNSETESQNYLASGSVLTLLNHLSKIIDDDIKYNSFGRDFGVDSKLRSDIAHKKQSHGQKM